jgi:hypothetical protein
MPRKLTLILMVTLVLLPWAQPGQAAEESGSPVIPLGRNLRFYVRPTLMGLVPPDNNEGYGEVFVRVLEVNATSLDVRYEIKEQALPDVDSGASPRIRRGQIHVTGLENGTGITPPLFWPDGDWTATDGLVWLPRADYRELVETGSCPWQIDYSSGLQEESIAELRQHLNRQNETESVADSKFRLVLESQGLYPCSVNGERTELAAQRAVDSLGLAEYWILADETNPLLLKLSFIPPALEAETADRSSHELDVLEAGIGCAVVEIDF